MMPNHSASVGCTIANFVGWVLERSINWDAWSAIGTICATLVALFLPARMAKREWVRQNSIRQEDADQARQKYTDLQQEVCSTVDRVLAYREAAIEIFDSRPVYWVGKQAIERINLNTSILIEMLEILVIRPELSDGAAYSAVAAKRIAIATKLQTEIVITSWATVDPGWSERIAALSILNDLAQMTGKRIEGVRTHFNLGESKGAKEIRAKYVPLATAIKEAISKESGEPANSLTEGYC